MLYIIATPIGNLSDITYRALETIESLDYLLCEDTRVTGMLLKNLEIKKQPKLISFYDEIEEQKIPEVIRLLESGANVGLVSDAGTPIISDPGFKLVRKCRSLGLQLTSIPGPSAVIDALVLSGLPSGRFSFLGFLPKKDGERKKILELYRTIDGSKIVYESPFRIKKLVEEVKLIFGNEHRLAICREMTKKFEEVIYGSAEEVEQILAKKNLKGEIVVVIA